MALHLSSSPPRATFWWLGRVWAAAVPCLFVITVADAFDGTGVAFAEHVRVPFNLAALVGVAFAIGAQGALLAVPRDLTHNMAAVMLGVTAIKLQTTYTHAYLVLHVAALSALALGYVYVARYADVHEAIREVAEDLVRTATAVGQPYVVTDEHLHVLAVNARFTEVLGYETGEVLGQFVAALLDNVDVERVSPKWMVQVLKKEGDKEHVWSVLTKDGKALPVRITFGETRCPTHARPFYWAKFASMALEQRNAQLCAEKERLQWEVASHSEGEADPRELLGATGVEGSHRTLGAMQDQQKTDDAVSCANSFDHVDSSASPTVPGQTLIAPAPPRSTSSIVSLESSVMDTVSQAAKKSPTRAPPPPKSSRLQRPTKVRSEPSAAKPTAGPDKNTTPKRVALPTIEHDPRERG